MITEEYEPNTNNVLLNEPEQNMEDTMFSRFIEEIISECGDLILKIFHSNGLTYSKGVNMEKLLENIQKSKDKESIRIINLV